MRGQIRIIWIKSYMIAPPTARSAFIYLDGNLIFTITDREIASDYLCSQRLIREYANRLSRQTNGYESPLPEEMRFLLRVVFKYVLQ